MAILVNALSDLGSNVSFFGPNRGRFSVSRSWWLVWVEMFLFCPKLGPNLLFLAQVGAWGSKNGDFGHRVE